MIPVEEALSRVLELVAPLETETVALGSAAGRVLAAPISAARDQPPFRAAAMDGYALRAADSGAGARLAVRGESAAGHGYGRALGAGEAVRIFTGAPVPEGADSVVAQEDTTAGDGTVTLSGAVAEGAHLRPAGIDFAAGHTLAPPRRLSPAEVALLAAMNVGTVPVARRPEVAVIATGDELVMPGETPGPDQIVASNVFAITGLVEGAGGCARLLPIARDTPRSLTTVLELAEGADLVVTVGGASVGDHDIVGEVAAGLGLERSFYKVAMRPGKPLMAGRLGRAAMVGLPGNPVSAIVCAHVFVLPALRRMLGLGSAAAPVRHAPLAAPVPANGPRTHYMRAALGPDGLTVFAQQDSSLLSVLAAADALAIRPPDDGPRAAGEDLAYLPLGGVDSAQEQV